MPDLTPVFFFAASLSVLLVGVAKTGFGGGIGVIAVPLMMAAAPPEMEAGTEQAILLPILCLCDLFAIHFYWRKWSARDVVRLLPGGMAGIVLGALLMKEVSGEKALLQLAIGLLSVLFVIHQARREWIARRVETLRAGWGPGTMFGGLAGFASMVAHAGGPPVVMFLLPRRLPRDLFVGSTVVFFIAVNYVKLVPYARLGLFSSDRLLASLALAPFVAIGAYLGVRLNRLINENLFRIVIYVLLLATGLKLLVTGFSGTIG